MLRILKTHSSILALAWGAISACSAPAEVTTGDDLMSAAGSTLGQVNAGGGAAGTSGAGPDGQGGSGGVAPPAQDPDSLITDATDGETKDPVSDENACAADALVPQTIEREVEHEVEIVHEELAPVAIYVVLDNSLSMADSPVVNLDAGAGAADSKWKQAVDALTGFVADPGSEGIGIAIQYFHPLGVGPAPDECDGSGHSTPDVAMDLLPANADAIVASLAQARPTGFTPTVGALTGGVEYCDAYQLANPDTKCAVVLVTDGLPRGCGLCEAPPAGAGGGGGIGGGIVATDCFDPLSESVLTPIAADGLASNVQTFTVGMNGITAEGFELLDAIAVAGGTDCTPDSPGSETCDVSETGAAGFAEALQAIRDSITVIETVIEIETVTDVETLACEWGIPDPPEGDTFYPNLVNVTLAKEGGEAADIGGVANRAECDQTGGLGWYYDDPLAPTLILACPGSCTEIETATDPEVKVLLGCVTVPPLQ